MAIIRVKTGPNKGRAFELKDTPLTVGREESQVIQILDQGVSRAHAEIFRLGEMCFVRDLNSTNGTFVNDVKITEECLKTGDELLIGTTLLAFDAAAQTGGPGVEFEGEEGAKIDAATVELKVDAQPTRALGKEVQSRNLTLLSQVSRKLREAPTPEALKEAVLDLLCGALGAGQGYVFEFDPECGKPVARIAVEGDDGASDRKVSRSIINRVLQSRLPLLTSDAALDGRFNLSESIVLKKIKSVICVPLLVSDRMEGVLYFHSSNIDHALGTEDLELATSAVLQLSTALAARERVDAVRKFLTGLVAALADAIASGSGAPSAVPAGRLAPAASAVAAELGLGSDAVEEVRLAALLHDVGRATAEEPGPEAALQAAERLLGGIEGGEQVLAAVRYQDERADGSGSPHRLRNEDTPVAARVLIVAKAFLEACAGGRDEKEVLKDMVARAGRSFDEAAVKALVLCHRNGKILGSTSARRTS